MGLRDIEAGAPVRPDTLFPICSVTKSFTATGLALLVDEGKLDWNTPVRETLPEFRLRDLVATEPAAWFENGTAQFATGVEGHIESVVVPLGPATPICTVPAPTRMDHVPPMKGSMEGGTGEAVTPLLMVPCANACGSPVARRQYREAKTMRCFTMSPLRVQCMFLY